MGGKHKQAQRTKNNARPSSSGRSAELLGSQAPKFVGFGAAKDGGYVAVLPGFSLAGSEVLDPNISSDFQIVLKKMSKKDATTKLKALQEFAELVGSSKEQDMSAVLPFWPRLYSHLAVDVEHRVREAAHQAQLAVVRSMRRNLAPYLRQLIGPWFTSQYDTYSPAASAATVSFQEAFPANKVPEVIVFCQNEILNYIYDNIIVQKPQTVGNPQVMTKEELEAKYERMLTSSLLGYALYLDSLPSDKLDLAREANKKIISSKKFWKYNKHPVSVVRSAWFKAVVALCRRCPDLLAEESSHATLAVFNNLDEADPVVLPVVWEAALHILTSLKDCWAHVSVEKLVLPKLWNILRQGGQGSATTIFPNLLPLLSRLPDSAATVHDKPHFFSLFFAHMRTGFSQKSVYQSILESGAVTKCYVECLRFVIIQHFEQQDLCFGLVENQLVPAIELTLTNDSSRVLAEALHHQVSLLARSWEEDERYSKLRTVFWRAVRSCVLGVLQQRPSSQVLDHVLLLCCCLHDPTHLRSRQSKHVSFATADADDNSVVQEQQQPVSVPASFASTPLQELVEDICKLYVELVSSGGSSYLLPHLTLLLSKFSSEQLLLKLSENCPSLLVWARNTVSKWLALDDCCPPQVIKLSFVLLEMLPQQDQLPLLQQVAQETQDGQLLVEFLQSVVLHHHIPAIATWLSGEDCCPLLRSLAHLTLVSQAPADARSVMKDILKWTPSGDLLLPVDTIESIVHLYWEALSSPWNKLEDVSCVAFVCELVCALYDKDLVVSPRLRSSLVCEDLVLLLFRSACRVDSPYQELREETSAAWAAAVGALSRAHGSSSNVFRDLVQRFAEVLQRQLFEPVEPEDGAVQIAVDIASQLLHHGARDPTGHLDRVSLTSLHVLLLDAMFQSAHIWQDQAADTCFYAMSAANTIYFPGCYPGVVSLTPCAEPNISRLVSLALLSAQLLARLFKPSQCDDTDSNSDDDDDDDEPLSLQETFCMLKEYMLSVLYTSTLASTFLCYFHATWCGSTIEKKQEQLDKLNQMMLATLTLAQVRELSDAICSRACNEGGLWLLVNNQLPLSTSLDLSCFDAVEPNTIPHLHVVQMYQWLKGSIRPEEHPAFIREVLNSVEVSDTTLAVASAWCECVRDCFLECLDFLQRCAEYARDSLASEARLWSDGRDVTALSWAEVSHLVLLLNFVTAVFSKANSLLKDRHELLTLMGQVGRDCMAVLLPLSRSLLEVRSQLLVPPAALRLPLARSWTVVLQGRPDDCKMQVLAISGLQLLAAFNKHLVGQNTSWEACYRKDVCETLSHIFLHVAEHGEVSSMTCHDHVLLERLADAVMSSDTQLLFSNWDAEKTVQFSSGLLTSAVPQLQRVGYHLLKPLLNQLVSLDASVLEKCDADLEDEEGVVGSLRLWRLRPVLDHTQSVMEALLSDFSLGDCCLVQPHTDSFAIARAYLFTWDLLLAMCAHADNDIRFHYASQLSKHGYVSSLLLILFRLMPEEMIQLKKSKLFEFLLSTLSSSGIELTSSRLTTDSLQNLVCLVYLRVLQRLPAVVRQWWAGLDSRAATLVEQVTAQYMSPTLCSLEMESLQSKNGNMTVHVYERAREVVARYHVEDVSLELSVVLPLNHPLGPVKVESVSRQPMVEYANWRNWIMQLTVFLAHQNGSLWDGLNLWKSNLDKRFEGIEECYICFSILHGSNFQTPRIRCDTCKKKFHSHCMYKWFDTSNKSTCPICRNFIM